MPTRKDPRTAVFGSSFDPPTGMGGHAGIVHYLSERFARVWLLPVYVHPFASKPQNVLFEDKLAMLQAAFSHLDNVSISQAERELFEAKKGASFGTLDVLEYLQQQKDTQHDGFVFVMGGDTLADLSMGKWRRSDELMARGDFIGIDRQLLGDNNNSSSSSSEVDTSKFARLEMVRLPGLGVVSSSEVRARLRADGDHYLEHLLDARVLRVIVDRGLYRTKTSL